MTNYIFITGGVVSSLGKGITSASIGCLLECWGLRVTLQKIDPYLNVDPGTMNPFQHGEVYVTEDGAETDLDLGHYERFTTAQMSHLNNVTSGQVYFNILERERQGDFLGETVQVIPHLTNEIKARIFTLAEQGDYDVIITEIGGTVGDIEGQHFLEAIRQIPYDVGRENVLYIHLTLIPYLKAAQEIKTKPTQHSVRTLREIGIQPDIIICRTERPFDAHTRRKIALFCNVKETEVFQNLDIAEVYQLPLIFHNQGLDQLLMEKLRLVPRRQQLERWRDLIDRIKSIRASVNIAVVGKYIHLQDAYKSIYEALRHGGFANQLQPKILRIDSEELTPEKVASLLGPADGILIPGGFGTRGIEGKILAARYAREHGIPFFGICLGMQCALIEFARHGLGLEGANSTEFDAQTPHPVIDLLEEQRSLEKKGGTMRLGAYPCRIAPDSQASKAYQQEEVQERHRHRFEVNPRYREQLEEAGLKFSGLSPDGQLCEIIELRKHRWYLGCQFHPEFKSRPLAPHPLFASFIKAANEYNKEKEAQHSALRETETH